MTVTGTPMRPRSFHVLKLDTPNNNRKDLKNLLGPVSKGGQKVSA